MASNSSTIETTTPTKPMRDARPLAGQAGDGRLLHKVFATRPAIAILASDASPKR